MRGQTIDTERSATEKKEEKAKEEKAKKAEEKAKKAEEKAEKAEEKAEEQDPCKYKGDGKVIPEHEPCPKPNKSESTPPIR
jgi:predicted ribosome quality control (RQC) complex YloA/Tae2 family protein